MKLRFFNLENYSTYEEALYAEAVYGNIHIEDVEAPRKDSGELATCIETATAMARMTGQNPSNVMYVVCCDSGKVLLQVRHIPNCGEANETRKS